jgi:acetyltransferase-like isoleucine patch superfamily enzyme
MYSLLKRGLRYSAFRHKRFVRLYRFLCNPSSYEYAEFLRLHGGFYSIGEGCSILKSTVFLDPAYVRIGNNVGFSTCTIIGHGGEVGVLNVAYNKKLESVGKVDIRDNSFIGYNALVMPNVTIGPNSIVAAGAVVTRDVAPGVIVGGVPAKVIGTTDEYVAKLEEQTSRLPWCDLLQKRGLKFDPAMEPELVRRRVEYFYGPKPENPSKE